MQSLTALGSAVGDLLKSRKETLAVAESSAGGLINASLVAVPGASAYYLGGLIVYTYAGREALLGITQRGDEGHALGDASPTRSSWRAACAPSSARPGASPRPAPADRAATATATRRDTHASRSAGRWRRW